MLRKLLPAAVLAAGFLGLGTTDAQAGGRHGDGDRHHDGHRHGDWDGGRRGDWDGHRHGGPRGGRVRIQPFPYHGGGFYGPPRRFYGSPWGGRPYRGGSGVFIGGPNFSFGYFGR